MELSDGAFSEGTLRKLQDSCAVLPQDTLPRAYEYELFSDYLKPFLVANPHRKYQASGFSCRLRVGQRTPSGK